MIFLTNTKPLQSAEEEFEVIPINLEKTSKIKMLRDMQRKMQSKPRDGLRKDDTRIRKTSQFR